VSEQRIGSGVGSVPAAAELLIVALGEFRTMGIKLSAKFARQESEQARLARIARKRVPPERIETIRRMLGIIKSERQTF